MEQTQFDQLATAVSQLADTVKNSSVKTDGEIVSMADKFKTELASITKRVDEFKFVDPALTTMEKGIVEDPEKKKLPMDLKKSQMIIDLHGYSPDPYGVKMHRPRSYWDKKKGWYQAGGYDGIEHIMEMNDTVILTAMLLQFQQTGQKTLGLESKPTETYKSIVKGLDSYKLFQSEIQANTELQKALDTATSGGASEFVPTQFSAKMIDDIRLKLKVASLFRHLNLPRSPFTNPAKGTRIRGYLVEQSTSDDATKIPTSDPRSRNITWTGVKFGVRNLWSDELDQDSIVPIMPWVKDEIIWALADAEEDCTINGDNSTTHMDNDITSANDVRKGYDGLRYFGYGSGSGYAAVDLGTFTTTTLRTIRGKMGRFGNYPSDLAWIASIMSFIKLLDLTEVRTVDKYGAAATILSGELAKLDGIAIIVSEFMRSDLNASGVYDGSTVNKTGLLLPNRNSFVYGDFANVKVETDRDIETGQTIMVSTRRQDMQRVHTPGATESNVGFAYNIAT